MNGFTTHIKNLNRGVMKGITKEVRRNPLIILQSLHLLLVLSILIAYLISLI